MRHGCFPPPILSAGILFTSRSLLFYVLIPPLIILLGIQSGHAATSLGTEEQRLRQRQDERNRQERIEAPDVRLESGTLTAIPRELPAEDLCFPISNLQLEIPGNITSNQPRLTRLLQPGGHLHFLQRHLDRYRNHCIGTEGINILVRQLTAMLLERGYTTTRIGIPSQDLATGSLELTLIPGTIRSIKAGDDSWPLSFNALPTRPGDLLNIRDLEQGLEQMMRISSQDVTFDLAPGDMPGESDVIVQMSRNRPVRAQLSIDDSGSEDTGRWRAGATLWLDGPLNLHDQLEIGYHDNANRHTSEKQSEELRLRYTLPWGWWLAELSASRYEYRQQIVGSLQSFSSRGETERLGGSLTYTLLRSQQQKLDVQLAARHRESSSYIDDVEIEVQRRDLTEAEVAILERIDLGSARLNLKLAHHWGASWFGAQENFPDRLPVDPSFFYRLQTLDATLATPFTIHTLPLRHTLTFHGQYADDQLFASEQLAIGSRYSVRGFDGDQMLSAERGFTLRNDLDIPLATTGQALFVGLDYGQVSGPSAKYLPGKELAGATIGVRGGWKSLSYETFASWPLKKPDSFETNDPVWGVSASLVF